MADILDAELLALAGDDSSSDEEGSAQQEIISPHPTSNFQPRTSEAPDMGRKGTAVVKKKSKRAKKVESEEGEA